MPAEDEHLEAQYEELTELDDNDLPLGDDDSDDEDEGDTP